MVWKPVHAVVAAVYLIALVATGWISGRKKRDSNQYLNATGALPTWLCATACIAANCGSLDVFAMMALGAQYGIAACHFYWIGATPALLVVALVLLPAYKASGGHTILDFIERHYDEQTRSIVALCMAAMMLLLAGVGLCALAQFLGLFLGWSFSGAMLIAVPVVLFYTWSGGIRATIYTELFHFALVIAAIGPLLFLVIGHFGGIEAFWHAVPAAHAHAWKQIPWMAPNAPMDRLGLVFGLGFVLSFSYWSTDFVQMQRALAVRDAQQAPYVPLSQAGAKMLFALLIVVPGVAAPLLLPPGSLTGAWNLTLPRLMLRFYSPLWLGIGFLGIAASLLSTFSNNVTGFTSAWVQGIYRQFLRSPRPDAYYMRMGRFTNAGAVLLSVGTAYIALHFQSIMEYVQLVLSTFNAPLFALMALGILGRGRFASGGRTGLLAGLAASIAHQLLVFAGVFHYGSQMAANFYGAVFGFGITLFVIPIAAQYQRMQSIASTQRWNQPTTHLRLQPAVIVASIVLAALFVAFNIAFW